MLKYKFGKSSLKKLEGVHPKLVEFARILLACSDYDLGISEGVRTLETQKEYYAKGRTKPGNIITNVDGINKKSKHQIQTDGYSHAVDIFSYNENGKVDYSDKYMDYVGKIGKKISYMYFDGLIHWGGDFKSLTDKPHWEYNPNNAPLTLKDL